MLEARIPGSSFDASGPQSSHIQKQEFVVAWGLLNLGLGVRGSADSLKLLTTCHVTMHVAFS